MIVITAHGRLAHQPEVKILPGGTSSCEFRLLSTRFAKGEEHVEAVTFFCYGDEAERFCDNTEKGQLISATGTQETQHYRSGEQDKHFVKYRLTWFEKGPKPNRAGQRPAGSAARPPSAQRQSQAPRQPSQGGQWEAGGEQMERVPSGLI